jgi:dUTP pyrophosphatase
MSLGSPPMFVASSGASDHHEGRPMPTIRCTRTPEADPAIALPSYETSGAAGADLRANFPPDQRAGLTLAPGARALVPTGLRLAIPEGHDLHLMALR